MNTNASGWRLLTREYWRIMGVSRPNKIFCPFGFIRCVDYIMQKGEDIPETGSFAENAFALNLCGKSQSKIYS
jgi:hypothetical protein